MVLTFEDNCRFVSAWGLLVLEGGSGVWRITIKCNRYHIRVDTFHSGGLGTRCSVNAIMVSTSCR